MTKKYTADDYIDAFRRAGVSSHGRRILLTHYHAPGQTISATQMSKAMGYRNHGGANLHYGILGKRIGENLGWGKPNLHVLVEFEKPEREWLWIMRPEVSRALERLGWTDADYSTIAEEVDTTAPLYEGAVRTISVNAYERNNSARERSILHHGCRCSVCGLVLAEVYGDVAQGYIHVHHLRQLSEINAQYEVDPVQDLRPVCPTCHAIIHTRTPPFTIEGITALVQDHAPKSRRAKLRP